jgi:hypothetical protein
VFAIVSISRADDIVLKNGTIIRNVKFIHNKLKSDGTTVAEYMFNGQLQSVVESHVLRVYASPLHVDQSAAFDTLTADQMDTTRAGIRRVAASTTPARPPALFVVKDRTFPNMHFLAVTIIGAAFSIDQFIRIGDINDAITQTQSIAPNADIGPLNDQKTRATVFGIIGTIGSAASLYYSLQSIEIGTNGQNISLAVHF